MYSVIPDYTSQLAKPVRFSRLAWFPPGFDDSSAMAREILGKGSGILTRKGAAGGGGFLSGFLAREEYFCLVEESLKYGGVSGAIRAGDFFRVSACWDGYGDLWYRALFWCRS